MGERTFPQREGLEAIIYDSIEGFADMRAYIKTRREKRCACLSTHPSALHPHRHTSTTEN